STVVGSAVALVTYFYPVRVVRGMERRVDALLTQQESLLETSRLLASTLDLQELLDRLSGIARSLPGIDVVRIWLRDETTGTLAPLAAVAIRNARNFGELTRRGERLRRVADLSRTVSSSLDLDAVLQQVIGGVLELRPDIGCFIRLVDAEAEVYRLGAVGGF